MKKSHRNQAECHSVSSDRSHLKLITGNSNSSACSIRSAKSDSVDSKLNILGRVSNNFQKESQQALEDKRNNLLNTRHELNYIHDLFERNQFSTEKQTTNSYSKDKTYQCWNHRTGYCHRRQFDSSQPTSFYGNGKIDNVFFCKTAQCVSCSRGYFCKKHQEIQKVLNHYEGLGSCFYMMTLTVSHNSKDSLADVSELASSCKTKLMKHKVIQRLGSIGHITRKEETVGRNGWHVHYHIIMFFDAELLDWMIHDLKNQWIKICGKAGNNVSYDNGLDMKFLSDGASQAASYVCKDNEFDKAGWTREGGTEGTCSTVLSNMRTKQAALEIGSVNTKQGRKESYTLSELISLAASGKWTEIFFSVFKTEKLILEYYSVKNKKTFQYSKNVRSYLKSISVEDSGASEDEEVVDEQKKIQIDGVVVYQLIQHKLWNKILLCNVKQADLNDVLAEMWEIIENSDFEEKYKYGDSSDRSIKNFIRLVDGSVQSAFRFTQTLFTGKGHRLLAA